VIEFDILFAHDAGEKAFLVFRMQGESTHYALRLTSTRDWTCYFAKFKGFGTREILGTQSAQGVFPVGVWSHVRVVINGSRFECYRDGFLIASADDYEWPIGFFGGIGFYSAYNRGLYHIDNLKICIMQ
jgi:hypothetical protein